MIQSYIYISVSTVVFVHELACVGHTAWTVESDLSSKGHDDDDNSFLYDHNL